MSDRTDAWLRGPSAVPTNICVNLKDDKTFASFEKYARPHGEYPSLPFRFQCHAAEFCENPYERRTDVAAFRRGQLDENHYKQCAGTLDRPRNGSARRPEFAQERPRDARCKTYMRLTGTTPSNHTVSIFVPHQPSVTARMPLLCTDADTEDEIEQWLIKHLRIPDSLAHLVKVRIFQAKPLMGYEHQMSSWAEMRLPNKSLRWRLMRSLKNAEDDVVNHQRPMTEALRAIGVHSYRPGAFIRVTGGRIASLDEQVEACDVEVRDARITCMNPTDDGVAPGIAPRKVKCFDFEGVNMSAKDMKFIDTRLEENRLNMCSVVIEQHGDAVPYDHEEEMRLVREEQKVEETKSGASKKNVGAAECGEEEAAAWAARDMRAPEDVTPVSSSGSKKKKRTADDMQVPPVIGRFIISFYPLPLSPMYTLIRVRNEVEMCQAIRRLGVRFRTSVTVTHNGDEFDFTAMRHKLVLHTSRDGPTCWFSDHPLASGTAHRELRSIVETQRARDYDNIVREEWEERRRSGWGRDDENGPPDESPGLWTPVPFRRDDRVRVGAFNLWLAWMEIEDVLGGAQWIRSHTNASVREWLPVLTSAPWHGVPCMCRRSWKPPRLVTRGIVAAWHAEVVQRKRGNAFQRAVVLKLGQFLGMFSQKLPHVLDAEFMDSDVSRPCPFTVQRASSKQKGSSCRRFYDKNSTIDMDTCVIGKNKWRNDPNNLSALAQRLKLPMKIEMPFSRMNRFGIRMREAMWRSTGATITEVPNMDVDADAAPDWSPSEPPEDETLASIQSVARASRVPVSVMTLFHLLAVYCVFDSILPLKILKRLHAVTEACLTSWYTRTSADTVFRRGINFHDSAMVVDKARRLNKVMNSLKIPYKGAIEGARVPEIVTRFFEFIITASLDVNSLYPSIILFANLCWSTIILCPKELQWAKEQGLDLRRYEFYGVVYHVVQYTKGDPRMEQGVLPQIMHFLTATRKVVKKMMKATEDDQEYVLLNIRQLALKVMANAMYGLLGFAQSALPAMAIAAMVTFEGRAVNLEMERAINEDFHRSRLLEIRDMICRKARVPVCMWQVDKNTPRMKGIGGDTDSIFMIVPVVDGDDTLVVLRTVWRRQPDGSYAPTTQQFTDESDPRHALAVKRFHARRAYGKKGRRSVRNGCADLQKAARAACAPEYTEVEAVTTRTVATRVAMTLVNHVTDHMESECFNARAHKMGRSMLGIGTDYISRKGLFFGVKKNYALLIWEDEDAMEDDDYKPKQAGLPNVKGDTPMIVRKLFESVVVGLQERGLEASKQILVKTCERILRNEPVPDEYTKRVKLNDPRHMQGEPAQVRLYKRMVERRKRRATLGSAVPEVGAFIPMVKTTQEWEQPDYIVAAGLAVDRNYYMDVIVTKMKFLGIDSLAGIAIKYMLMVKQGKTGTKLQSKDMSMCMASNMATILLRRERDRTKRHRARKKQKASVIPGMGAGAGSTNAVAEARKARMREKRLRKMQRKSGRRHTRRLDM